MARVLSNFGKITRKLQVTLHYIKLRSRGLEPPCLSTLEPESSASAISPRARLLLQKDHLFLVHGFVL